MATQPRCPRCCAEIYVMNVLAFSLGELACHKCQRRSVAMTKTEWLAAIAGGGFGSDLEAWLGERRIARLQGKPKPLPPDAF